MLEFNKMTTIIKNILFLLNSFWIIFSEIIGYYMFNNNEVLINNVIKRLSKTNILFIKLFQAIALNTSIIDEKINKALLKYTDNAPYTEKDIDYNLLYNMITEFNLKIENNFMPINSGMISLVFKATKVDTNEIVILKMKRKNIEKHLDDAIDNLMFVVYILSYFSVFQRYEIPASIAKNIGIIRSQTDFNQEIKNMTLMKKNCMRLNYVVIPKFYPEVTEKYNNLIMMEFIQGQKIDQISKEDYYDFAIKLNKFVFITLLMYGTTHGDLHGGNVLFIKDFNNDNNDNIKIGLIDFGILYKTSKLFNEVLFDYCTEIFTKSPEEVAVRILTNGFFDPPDILDKLSPSEKKYIIELISKVINDSLIDSNNANQKKIYEFLFNLNNFVTENNLEKYGLKLNDEFIKLQMFIAMYQGVSFKLSSTEYIAIMNKVISELYLSTMSKFIN
jgi:predicted unusual protein kinase regulating ubiquinone biosynthesis (AarF/ABC1/UbiB family)